MSSDNTVNKLFKKFKNLYSGHTCILLCTGPTLNDFKIDHFKRELTSAANANNKIYVAGVNSALYYTKDMDFYFFGDRDMPHERRCHPYLDEIKSLPNSTLKFASVYRDGSVCNTQVSPSFAQGVGAFAFADTLKNPDHFEVDIASSGLSCQSVAFQALQFLLYAGFSTIYLVGCDCAPKNGESHFTGNTREAQKRNFRYTIPKKTNKLLSLWSNFKTFCTQYYPNTHIISVNPIGLKGMFDNV